MFLFIAKVMVVVLGGPAAPVALHVLGSWQSSHPDRVFNGIAGSGGTLLLGLGSLGGHIPTSLGGFVVLSDSGASEFASGGSLLTKSIGCGLADYAARLKAVWGAAVLPESRSWFSLFATAAPLNRYTCLSHDANLPERFADWLGPAGVSASVGPRSL
jgi:hypothetical protein